MNPEQTRNINARNRLKGMLGSSTSRNELMEKNNDDKEEDENISYEDIHDNKNIVFQRKKKIPKHKSEVINSIDSKRGSENRLLLKRDNNFKSPFPKLKDEKSNINLNFNEDKVQIYTYHKDNFNKDKLALNYNETENYIEENKNKIKFNESEIEEEEKEEKKGIDIDEIYNLIIGYNFNKIINPDYYKIFFLSPVPEDKTLSMNINKIKNKESNSSGLNFHYNLEILRNNQIYFFAQIKKSFPSSNIKLYVKLFNDQYIKVGKIISNILKNNFIVYKGDNKSNYKKILNITYEINFFGNKIRKMSVEKFENNKIKFILCNDLPEWDYFYKTYKMNFNGRVKQKSKKNFILKYKNSENEENKNEKLLQCGKIDDNCYALDFISPLSPFEAFAISITSVISKLSCE